MANRALGEVSVKIADTSYTLCLDLNAMCQVEDLFSTPTRTMTFQDVLAQVQASNMRAIRAVLWASFIKYHPEIKLTDVAPLAQQAGGILAFASTIARLAEGAQPEGEDVEALGLNGKGGGAAANPHKAQAGRAAGTGRRSSTARD